MKKTRKVFALVLAALTVFMLSASVYAATPMEETLAADKNLLAAENNVVAEEVNYEAVCEKCRLGTCSCGDNCKCPEGSCCKKAKKVVIWGYITSGTTGAPIKNAIIRFRSGYNKQSGSVVRKVKSGANGKYVCSLPVGKYTVGVGKANYISTYINVNLTKKKRFDVSISPRMAAKTYRAVLTWGANPRDVDAHLTGPNYSSGRFHVYFGNKNFYNTSSSVVSNLDVDDTTSYGPETVTINFSKGKNGVYRYYLHDYTNRYSPTSRALSASGAKVVLYAGSRQIAVYHVPTGKSGNVWHVFNLTKSGSRITLKKINKLSNTNSLPIT